MSVQLRTDVQNRDPARPPWESQRSVRTSNAGIVCLSAASPASMSARLVAGGSVATGMCRAERRERSRNCCIALRCRRWERCGHVGPE